MQLFDIKKFMAAGNCILLLKEYRCDDIPPRLYLITEYQSVMDEKMAIKCPELFDGSLIVDDSGVARLQDSSLVGDLYMSDKLEVCSDFIPSDIDGKSQSEEYFFTVFLFDGIAIAICQDDSFPTQYLKITYPTLKECNSSSKLQNRIIEYRFADKEPTDFEVCFEDSAMCFGECKSVTQQEYGELIEAMFNGELSLLVEADNKPVNIANNPRILRVYNAMDTLYATMSELCSAYLDLDSTDDVENAILEKLVKFYPKSLTGSLDDIASDVYKWCEAVQKGTEQQKEDQQEKLQQPSQKMKLHEFLHSLHLYQYNKSAINVRNELCVAFGGLDPKCTVDIESELSRWSSNEDIYLWYAWLPQNQKTMILNYYSKILNITVDTTSSYTKAELVDYINDMGNTGGGCIEVKGTGKGGEVVVVVDQNEWRDSPVCFIGGYGNEVRSIDPNNVLKELPDILDNYFDSDSIFTILDADE